MVIGRSCICARGLELARLRQVIGMWPSCSDVVPNSIMWRWANIANACPGVRSPYGMYSSSYVPPPPTTWLLAEDKPYRTPERPFSSRNTSTVVACPDRIAPTAWPTIAAAATPPGPTSAQ